METWRLGSKFVSRSGILRFFGTAIGSLHTERSRMKGGGRGKEDRKGGSDVSVSIFFYFFLARVLAVFMWHSDETE